MLIGIDFGKNIGIAYAVGTLAVPYCTVHTVADAAKKIQEKRATKLIVGWPLMLNGKEGEQCVRTKNMLDELLKICGLSYDLPYVLQDERFSSRFVGSKHVDKKDEHAHSAAWVLQTFLDRA